MAISDDRDERFRAYAESRFRFDHPTIGTVEVWPDPSGATTGHFPLPSDVTVHVVTSHNPGRELTAPENDERHRRLAAWLDARPHLSVWAASGGNSDWSHSEASFAIVGLSDAEARALGREFGQEAVFAWCESELLVMSCVGEGVTRLGWAMATMCYIDAHV